ncbi:DNA gyrase subunit A [Desulfacinum hydrothermale DSM 13146]|uniref:DNA gyrase subunit A n=1 Tax=Desulfacinum hydrothermale DSM 13146 TaxID=1121390 RepID=A0A1W1XHS4_9BACT|nr:DNA gyrase subunit A [Desulfacinum hydrothermale]SMC23543.1 DNA gyrase subunit A [Desulfacinum hydrothermale DSM 13146]
MTQPTINIEDEIKLSYLDYAMSVIIGRALPDVRDGLKPVHRRVLYAMHELKNDYNKPYKKSARIVGDVIGKYHPHGDSAVYDTIVRMAQDFSMRYPLVDGQGNFGSVDGDPPAAMRYTEIRMARLAHEFLKDIEKKTVEFAPNYDNSLQEPTVLPTRVPNLLLNGSSGIAVGMATNIPPHNITELCRGLQALLKDPGLTSRDLMEHIPGPDFPTGGFIVGKEGIREAYETGRGLVRMRGRVELEEAGKRQQLVVTELPYQVNKAKLQERIAELVKEKRITGIQDIRDESSREGMRIVLVLKTGENPQVVENQLYKFTALESTFGVILLAVVDNRPQLLNLKGMLSHFLDFRRQVVIRRTRYDLEQAEKRAHVLEGLKIALDHLDAIIQLIRSAPNPPTAKERLMDRFGLSAVQAQAILDMRLQRLTGLERDKILKEYEQVLKDIERYRQILASPALVDQIIHEELEELVNTYGDGRRTEIVPDARDVSLEDLIDEKEVVVTISHAGYVKRTPVEIYRSQRRGGRGRMGMSTRKEDFVRSVFTASTHDYLLVFTSLGRLYWLKVYNIPEVGPTASGKAIVNLLPLLEGERVATVMPVRAFDEGYHVVMATRKGIVKKTALSAFANPRSVGIRAIRIDEGDELISVCLTDGKQDLFFMSRAGKCIRIHETTVRAMGRSTRGVKAMELAGSELIGMDTIIDGHSILVVTQKGFGKRTASSAYRVQGRGGQGVINIKITHKNGPVVAFRQVSREDEILLITNTGRLIRLAVADIREVGRSTQGVKLMDLNEGEEIVDAAVVAESEEE